MSPAAAVAAAASVLANDTFSLSWSTKSRYDSLTSASQMLVTSSGETISFSTKPLSCSSAALRLRSFTFIESDSSCRNLICAEMLARSPWKERSIDSSESSTPSQSRICVCSPASDSDSAM